MVTLALTLPGNRCRTAAKVEKRNELGPPAKAGRTSLLISTMTALPLFDVPLSPPFFPPRLGLPAFLGRFGV